MKRSILFFASAALLAAASAAQQVVTTSVQFSFSNPGARSLAFGGAFAALADDATAAYANPAGLVQLTRPEVSLEGRAWGYTTPFTSGGRAAGPPTGLGIDVTPGVVTDESSASLEGLSFLSYITPLGRWTLAFYRHQLANFESSFETQSIFITYPDGSIGSLLPKRGWFDLEVVSHSVAAGVKVTETLSLGLGLSYFEADLVGIEEIYFPDDATVPDLFAPLSFGPTSFLPERHWGTGSLVSHDTDFGWSAGLLWKLPRGWSLGGFYRQGPTMEGSSEFRSAVFHPQPPDTVLVEETGSLTAPDVYGLGLARSFPGDRLILSFEWDRVEYATLLEDADDRCIGDADEIRLGAEYTLLRDRPILAFRAGAWLDPDHSIQITSDNVLLAAAFPPGGDELHLTAGLGMAFGRFQLDLGFDFSDLRDTASLSAIFSF